MLLNFNNKSQLNHKLDTSIDGKRLNHWMFYTGNAREVAVAIKVSVVSGAGDADLLDIYEEVK